MELDTDKLTISQVKNTLTKIGIRAHRNTIINWCLRYGIGSKVGGRWYVDKSSLMRLIREK